MSIDRGEVQKVMTIIDSTKACARQGCAARVGPMDAYKVHVPGEPAPMAGIFCGRECADLVVIFELKRRLDEANYFLENVRKHRDEWKQRCDAMRVREKEERGKERTEILTRDEFTQIVFRTTDIVHEEVYKRGEFACEGVSPREAWVRRRSYCEPNAERDAALERIVEFLWRSNWRNQRTLACAAVEAVWNALHSCGLVRSNPVEVIKVNAIDVELKISAGAVEMVTLDQVNYVAGVDVAKGQPADLYTTISVLEKRGRTLLNQAVIAGPMGSHPAAKVHHEVRGLLLDGHSPGCTGKK